MTDETPRYKTQEYLNSKPVKNVEREANRKLRPGEVAWLGIPEEDRPVVGEEYKGIVIADFCDRGYPIGINSRNLVLGTLAKGNSLNGGKGRVKGSRNKLTQQMLNVVAAQQISPAEFLALVMANPEGEYSQDAQIKAALKLTDIVYPKASSVEMEIVDDAPQSREEMDEKLKLILGNLKISVD